MMIQFKAQLSNTRPPTDQLNLSLRPLSTKRKLISPVVSFYSLSETIIHVIINNNDDRDRGWVA